MKMQDRYRNLPAGTELAKIVLPRSGRIAAFRKLEENSPNPAFTFDPNIGYMISAAIVPLFRK
jgi:hypothetical protein